MVEKLIIIGGGEHANCVYDAAMLSGLDVIGFVDREEKRLGTAPYLGGDAVVANYPDVSFIVGVGVIGPGRARNIIVDRLLETVKHWATIVHPRAIVSPRAKIGAGVLIMPGSIVNAGATIGDHCIINSGAIVEHDCEIGAFSHLCPGVVMGGGAKIGENSVIGLGSRIRDHISLGARTFVAMGSVVTKSFQSDSRVLGAPARQS